MPTLMQGHAAHRKSFFEPLACGYSDQSAFSRQFKEAVSISPMAYRKKTGTSIS